MRPCRTAQCQKKPLRLVEFPQAAPHRLFQQLLLDLLDAVADGFQDGKNLIHGRVEKSIRKVVGLHAAGIPTA